MKRYEDAFNILTGGICNMGGLDDAYDEVLEA